MQCHALHTKLWIHFIKEMDDGLTGFSGTGSRSSGGKEGGSRKWARGCRREWVWNRSILSTIKTRYYIHVPWNRFHSRRPMFVNFQYMYFACLFWHNILGNWFAALQCKTIHYFVKYSRVHVKVIHRIQEHWSPTYNNDSTESSPIPCFEFSPSQYATSTYQQDLETVGWRNIKAVQFGNKLL